MLTFYFEINNFWNLLRQKLYKGKVTGAYDIRKPLGLFPFGYLYHFPSNLSYVPIKKAQKSEKSESSCWVKHSKHSYWLIENHIDIQKIILTYRKSYWHIENQSKAVLIFFLAWSSGKQMGIKPYICLRFYLYSQKYFLKSCLTSFQFFKY